MPGYRGIRQPSCSQDAKIPRKEHFLILFSSTGLSNFLGEKTLICLVLRRIFCREEVGSSRKISLFTHYFNKAQSSEGTTAAVFVIVYTDEEVSWLPAGRGQWGSLYKQDNECHFAERHWFQKYKPHYRASINDLEIKDINREQVIKVELHFPNSNYTGFFLAPSLSHRQIEVLFLIHKITSLSSISLLLHAAVWARVRATPTAPWWQLGVNFRSR